MNEVKNKFVSKNNDWWRGGVIYQIYPRSYQDGNGDGIGDLIGITSRLPYIAQLGVDAIWISPFFKSPMKDFGYDVSDYLDVDPLFGSLADFDTLVEKAHALGLRVMIDLVLSHSSDQHSWFKESRQNKENDKSDWYVWADAKPDGSAPNNWLSIFGGPAWNWDSRRCQYYMHNFLSSQPDLNFHNPEVQNALLDVAEFWLKLGVDGFRLDTINFYFCDKQLRNNPPLPVDQRNDSIAPSVNPYNHQDHLYDKSQPENILFLERLRTLLDGYPGSAIVGEVGDAHRGMEILADYTKGKNRVHMCYAFDFLCSHPPTADYFAEVLEKFNDQAPDSWACWAFSNHDVVRHASRWSRPDELQDKFQKMLTTLLLSLRGSVCLYQGEELGLTEAVVAFEDLQDPYGIEFWPEFVGRDGCRTPMVWNKDATNGGFSDSAPWLPVENSHLEKAVSAQQSNADSLLEHYRAMLRFRTDQPILSVGDISEIKVEGNVLSFYRIHKGKHCWCCFNFGDIPQNVKILENTKIIEAPSSLKETPCNNEGEVELPACCAMFTMSGEDGLLEKIFSVIKLSGLKKRMFG